MHACLLGHPLYFLQNFIVQLITIMLRRKIRLPLCLVVLLSLIELPLPYLCFELDLLEDVLTCEKAFFPVR